MLLPALIAATQEIEIKGVFRLLSRARARARLKNPDEVVSRQRRPAATPLLHRRPEPNRDKRLLIR